MKKNWSSKIKGSSPIRSVIKKAPFRVLQVAERRGFYSFTLITY